MKMPAVVIASASYLDWLRRCTADWLELTVLSAEEASQQAPALASAALLLVEMDGPDLHDRTRLIEQLGERQPDLPIIALGSGDQPDAMLFAMRAGARDFLVPGRDDAGAVGQMERVLRRGAKRGPGRGQVIAVVSGHPSTGTVFLAEHIALAAGELMARNEPILLLDLAQPAGAAAVFLNTHQEYNALNAIQDAYRCDQTLVDTAFGHHSSGLYVLGLPEAQIGALTLEADDLSALLDVLRGLFALTVIACDATLGLAGLQAVIERAGHSLLLGDHTQQPLQPDATTQPAPGQLPDGAYETGGRALPSQIGAGARTVGRFVEAALISHAGWRRPEPHPGHECWRVIIQFFSS
jgi:pilus assembly protein CpaE